MSTQRFLQPSAVPQPTLTSSDRAAQRAYLHALHGGQRGYLELSYIKGDPQYPKLSEYVKVGYYDLPHQFEELLDNTAHYTSLGYNVYWSSGLYGSKSRKHPLPSCVVFVDEAPPAPELPYSLVVQTSAEKRHAYYLLDAPVSPEERRDLQRRAAAALGSDRSGSDVEQIVRPPATVNTKNHGRFPVALITANELRYTAEQLRAAWPAVPDRVRRREGATCAIDAALWQQAAPHLANIDALLGSGRVRAMKPTTQAARILAGERLTYLVERQGHNTPDDSRSMNGCALAHGLRAHRFPDEEIAAIVYTMYERWDLVEDKGSSWAHADVERCIASAHEAYPTATADNPSYPAVSPAPTRYRQASRTSTSSRTPRSRARTDRPQIIESTDDLLLRLLDLQDTPGKICKDRRELAHAIGISPATLDRYLEPLRHQGLARWELYNQRQESYLVVSDAALMMRIRPPAISTADDVSSGPAAEGSTARQSTNVPVHEGTHAAPGGGLGPSASAVLDDEPALPPARSAADDATPAPVDAPAETPAAAACVPPLSPPQDIDISRERGSATEERMAQVYRWQGELVRIIPRDEQKHAQRGDLERLRPGVGVICTEVKGEREYPGRCAAVEVETVPLNRVAYGGPSGPAESKADTFVYMNTTTGAWWELEVATVRALLPEWRQRYRLVDGKVNERDTPYGHARYHTRCLLVPQAELARHAIAHGVAPTHSLAAEPAHRAYEAVRSVETVNKRTGEIKRQVATIGRVLAELEREGYSFPKPDVEAALVAAREQHERATLLASIADLKLDGLRAQIRLAERLMERADADGTEAGRFWWVVRRQCQERLAILPPESREQKAARKRGGEAKPSPRKAGEAYQAELWEVADRALDEQRAARPAPVVVTPPPAPPAPVQAQPAEPYTSAEYAAFAEIAERIRQGLGIRRLSSTA